MIVRTFKSYVGLSYLGDAIMTESDTKMRILKLLASSERGLSWKELKAELKVSDPVLAKHLKKLIEEGLITEEIDKKDRRVKRYKLNKIGLDALREELLGFLCYIWMTRNIERIWRETRKKMSECRDEECIKAIAVEYCESIRNMIGNFFFLTCPDDFTIFVNALGYLCEVFKLHFAKMRKLFVTKEIEEFFSELKRRDTEDLLKEVLAWIKGLMINWMCLVQTSPEEAKEVIAKYYCIRDEKELSAILEEYLILREDARNWLDAVKSSWIGKMIKIDPSEIPTFEEFIRKVHSDYEKSDKDSSKRVNSS